MEHATEEIYVLPAERKSLAHAEAREGEQMDQGRVVVLRLRAITKLLGSCDQFREFLRRPLPFDDPLEQFERPWPANVEV